MLASTSINIEGNFRNPNSFKSYKIRNLLIFFFEAKSGIKPLLNPETRIVYTNLYQIDCE